jgi:hypothetical protein
MQSRCVQGVDAVADPNPMLAAEIAAQRPTCAATVAALEAELTSVRAEQRRLAGLRTLHGNVAQAGDSSAAGSEKSRQRCDPNGI